jgi:hypothetical protein
MLLIIIARTEFWGGQAAPVRRNQPDLPVAIKPHQAPLVGQALLLGSKGICRVPCQVEVSREQPWGGG